jgi:hypothetical protein
MTDIPDDIQKLAAEGMSLARSEDFPAIEIVAKLTGDTAGFIATEVLDKMSPALRDMLLGSVQLKLAITILLAGSAGVTRERFMQMVEFYANLIEREKLEAEREKAGGIQ